MRTLPIKLALCVSVACAAPAHAEIGEWAETDAVSLRLVATGTEAGLPVAALEIVMATGWKTYWRTPGEGGLAPIFNFDYSRNLAAADVSFPAPHRWNDGYSVTNVYEGRVILPMAIDREFDDTPVTIHLTLELGVCETICIPMTIETGLTFDPDATDADALAIIAEGYGLLPEEPTPGSFAIEGIRLLESDEGPDRYEVEATVPVAFGAELFVESPDEWPFSPPWQIARDGDRVTFAMDLGGDAEAGASGIEVTFTLTSAGMAVEQTVTLP